MTVGTHDAGDGRYGPEPSGAGTHDGTSCTGAPGLGDHWASFLESQPHPGPVPAVPVVGLLPEKPSSVDATSSRWAPQLGTGSSSKVRSEIPNCRASADRLGIEPDAPGR